MREGGRRGRWRDPRRGGLGHPQDPGGAGGDKEIAQAVRARTRRKQYKPATEERMAGVGDLDFGSVVARWGGDRGMKVCARSRSEYPLLGRVDELFDDNPHGNEMYQSQKGLAQFLIPRGNASKLLEIVKEPFYLLTEFVEVFIIV